MIGYLSPSDAVIGSGLSYLNFPRSFCAPCDLGLTAAQQYTPHAYVLKTMKLQLISEPCVNVFWNYELANIQTSYQGTGKGSQVNIQSIEKYVRLDKNKTNSRCSTLAKSPPQNEYKHK